MPESTINTAGGAFSQGDINVEGNFTGRDEYINNNLIGTLNGNIIIASDKASKELLPLTFPDEATCNSIDRWLEQTEPHRYRQGSSIRTTFDKDNVLGLFEKSNFVDQCLQYIETRGVNLYVINAITLLKQRSIKIDEETLTNNKRTIVFVRKINAVLEQDQIVIYSLWANFLSPSGLATQEMPISLAVSIVPFVEAFEHIQKYDLWEKIADRLKFIDLR